ncbi:MAG TPA: hypothetical protein VEJ18_15420 [Planctomycetota bacterium]|nr:hypothetical protein [Planctomycetota bacterium]
MIAEEWKKFEAAVIPPGAPEVQRVECRRAFWAGAAACFYGVLRGMSPGEQPTEGDLKFMDEVDAEFKAYAEECKAAAERMLGPGVQISMTRPQLPIDKICNLKGCGKPAQWQVGLAFFAAGHTKATQGIRAELGMALCVECARTTKAEDFITDEGWERICTMLERTGKLRPERSLTKLELLPILRAGA